MTGAAHFIFPRVLDSIVPRILPGRPRIWTYLSGIAELAISAGLFINILQHLAAIGAVLLFIAVFPANIQMAYDWRNRRSPYKEIAFARLPLQFLLIFWAFSLI